MTLNANTCVVMGPVKSGTTLMISLMDSHKDLSLFPMEVKFFTHWLERLSDKQPTYTDLNEFFFEESKIRLMNNNLKDRADIMNSGRIDFSGFNYSEFKHEMNQAAIRTKEVEISGTELFRKFIRDIHETLDALCGKNGRKVIVSKEGNHGAKYLNQIRDLYPRSKFIVIVRDPRDIFVSFKAIAEKKKAGLKSPSFKEKITPCRFINGNKGKNIYAYNELAKRYKGSEDFCFVRYEDLVSNTAKEMTVVAKFLGVKFTNELISPTNLGNPWGGNASSLIGFERVESNRTEKWRKELESSERRIIEYFCYGYLESSGYDLPMVKPLNYRVILDILLTEVREVRVSDLTSIRGLYYLFKKAILVTRACCACLFRMSVLGR